MRGWLLVLTLLAAPAPARAAAPFDPLHAATIEDRMGGQLPMHTLVRDADGRTTTLASLTDGKPILLAPVQHRCPNLCGYTLDGLAGRLAETRLGGKVTVLAFSIDPKETSEDAKVSSARLSGLTTADAVVADAKAVTAVTGALGYRYAWDPQLEQYAHLAAVAVLTPDGRLSSWLYGLQPPAPVLRAAVQAAGRGRVAAIGDRLILLCYHYDPQTGRYDSRIALALKLGAATVVLGLAGFIALALRRERRNARP